MRILIVNDYGTAVGGAEAFTFALRDTLRQQGHHVGVFASSAGTPAAAQQADFTCLGTLSPFRTWLQTANPWAYFRLRRVLTEFKPDVVHVRIFLTQLSPLILPLLRRVPSLYHVVWYRPVCPTGTKFLPTGEQCRVPAGLTCYRNGCLPMRDWIPLRFQAWLLRRWRHVFRRIVANSHAVQRSLLTNGLGPVEVIHNGVAIEPLPRPWSEDPLVVFAGRLVREKGVDVLVRALALVLQRLPAARLYIAGDGPERQYLTDLAEKLGVATQVTFLGHLQKESLQTTLAPAWVQAVPSRWAEPFGLVAVEAMMRQTAVIATRLGGLTEIVEDGQTGYLVPPGDPLALAQKLEELLGDRSRADSFGRAGRRSAETRFDLARQCDLFVSLYREMVTEGGSSLVPWSERTITRGQVGVI